MDNNLLENIELFATGQIANQFSDRLVFHDASRQYRLADLIESICLAEEVSAEEHGIITAAGWFYNLGLIHLDEFPRAISMNIFISRKIALSKDIARKFLDEHQYQNSDQVISLLAEMDPNSEEEKSHLGKILSDAIHADAFESKKRIHKYYEEMLLCHVNEASKSDFLDFSISLLSEHKYYTDFAIRDLRSSKESLIAKLLREKKDLKKMEDAVLRTELGIEEGELKKLKRTLEAVSGRDNRGVQTVFRTTSRNHYTLSEMVDRKSNIMISVNAIILSLIIGKIFAGNVEFSLENIPLLIMLVASAGSIIFAVYAIRPEKTHGKFTAEDIRNKHGNLLFFGNFHNMSLRDYEWGMLQMLNDGDFLYGSMIKDLYYLGLTLNKKYKSIRLSLEIFTVGIIGAVISFLIVYLIDTV